MTRLPRFANSAVGGVLVVFSACSFDSPTIVGEITDTSIDIDMSSAPWPVWVEFTNVGSTPCGLMEIVTELPADDLPLNPDGTVDMSGTPEAPGLGPGSYSDSGDVMAPGGSFRFRESDLDDPGAYLAGARIFLCGGPGDYEAGRYAVVEIDPPFGSPPQ
jgi:hypothetical protein